MSQIITLQGWDYLLNTGLQGAPQATQWYVLIYTNNYDPQVSDTMTGFPSAAGEITDYVGGTRPAITFDNANGGVIDNTNNVLEIEMTETVSVQGAAIVSVAAKGAATGTLLAAGRFTSPKIRESGEVLNLIVGLNGIECA